MQRCANDEGILNMARTMAGWILVTHRRSHVQAIIIDRGQVRLYGLLNAAVTCAHTDEDN